jgi:hypothetical protein
MSTTPKDVFQRYAIPPSRLHDAVQGLARQAGWTAPWDREEQHEEQQSQKKTAGKLSGLIRERRAKLRRSIVVVAHLGLKPAYRSQPYSTQSIDVLQEEYLKILRCEPNNLLDVACIKLERAKEHSALSPEGDCFFRFYVTLLIKLPKLSPNERQILENISDETLIKDLKLLGIRSKRSIQRSG